MTGSAWRLVGTWLVTTALIVLGVDAAIGRVARDVTLSRPAPMTPDEVDEELRDRDGTTPSSDELAPEPTDTLPTTTTSPRPVPPGSIPPATPTGTGQPHGPDSTGPETTGPDPTGEPRNGVGAPSTTTGGAPGGPVGQEGPPRP